MENLERTRYLKRVAVGMPLKLWTKLHETALDEEMREKFERKEALKRKAHNTRRRENVYHHRKEKSLPERVPRAE